MPTVVQWSWSLFRHVLLRKSWPVYLITVVLQALQFADFLPLWGFTCLLHDISSHIEFRLLRKCGLSVLEVLPHRSCCCIFTQTKDDRIKLHVERRYIPQNKPCLEKRIFANSVLALQDCPQKLFGTGDVPPLINWAFLWRNDCSWLIEIFRLSTRLCEEIVIETFCRIFL